MGSTTSVTHNITRDGIRAIWCFHPLNNRHEHDRNQQQPNHGEELKTEHFMKRCVEEAMYYWLNVLIGLIGAPRSDNWPNHFEVFCYFGFCDKIFSIYVKFNDRDVNHVNPGHHALLMWLLFPFSPITGGGAHRSTGAYWFLVAPCPPALPARAGACPSACNRLAWHLRKTSKNKFADVSHVMKEW